MQRTQHCNFAKEVGNGEGNIFAGHIVSQNGIRPDDSKYRAIAEFPTPENVSQLRSFLGLANQLTAFVPDLAHMTATLRPLLKKGTAWAWTRDMQEDFKKVKLLLTTTTTVQPFNPTLESILMTDASRLFGIGFALLQPLPKEKWSLIQNMMGIFSKKICDLENPRLMRMREKIMEYTPVVKWVPGKPITSPTPYLGPQCLTQTRKNTLSPEITRASNLPGIASKRGQSGHFMQPYKKQ